MQGESIRSCAMGCQSGASSKFLEPDFRGETSSPDSFTGRYSSDNAALNDNVYKQSVAGSPAALPSTTPASSIQEQQLWALVQELQQEVARQTAAADLARERQRQAQLDTQASQRCVQRLLGTNAQLERELQEEQNLNGRLYASLVMVSNERDALKLKSKLATDQANYLYASLNQSLVKVSEREQQNAALVEDLAGATAEAAGLRAQLRDKSGGPTLMGLPGAEGMAQGVPSLRDSAEADFQPQPTELAMSVSVRSADKTTSRTRTAKGKATGRSRQPARKGTAKAREAKAKAPASTTCVLPSSPAKARRTSEAAATPCKRAKRAAPLEDLPRSTGEESLPPLLSNPTYTAACNNSSLASTWNTWAGAAKVARAFGLQLTS